MGGRNHFARATGQYPTSMIGGKGNAATAIRLLIF